MIDRRPVTTGLAALLATLTGRPVGLETVPLDAQARPVPPPYTLLYSLDDTDSTATLADDATCLIVDYQATFVSRGVEQAETLADRGRRVIQRPDDGIGYLHPLNVGPGVTCYHREARSAGGTGDAADAIINRVIRYRLYLQKTA